MKFISLQDYHKLKLTLAICSPFLIANQFKLNCVTSLTETIAKSDTVLDARGLSGIKENSLIMEVSNPDEIYDILPISDSDFNSNYWVINAMGERKAVAKAGFVPLMGPGANSLEELASLPVPHHLSSELTTFQFVFNTLKLKYFLRAEKAIIRIKDGFYWVTKIDFAKGFKPASDLTKTEILKLKEIHRKHFQFMILWDLMAGENDRHIENWMVDFTRGEIRLIDNSRNFSQRPPKIRTDPAQYFPHALGEIEGEIKQLFVNLDIETLLELAKKNGVAEQGILATSERFKHLAQMLSEGKLLEEIIQGFVS